MSNQKWFIYVQDHHEGPFTVTEIQNGIDSGRFSKDGFVWADGMTDWLPMAQVPEFSAAPAPAPAPIPPLPVAAPVAEVREEVQEPLLEARSAAPAPVAEPSAVAEPVAAEAPTPVEQEERTNTTIVEISDLDRTRGSGLLRPESFKVSSAMKPVVMGDLPDESIIQKMKPLIFAVLIIFALVGLKALGLLRGVENQIRSVVSTLPELTDIGPDEYEDLKKAVKAPISAGPQVAIALSKADPLSPIFYVATNLPEGARFEIYVEGVPHTLLNTLQFSGRLDVKTTKNLAKSAALRYPDGKPIPRGEYTIYVMEAPSGQPDLVYKELLQLAPIARNLPNHLPQERRLVFSKKIFFGSKDATYQQRLKEFHDGLVAKAKAEVTELSQAAATLESQALVSTSSYDRLRRQRIGAPQKQAWNEMNRTWRPVEAQIVQKYAGLTPEQTQENYFHANLIREFLAIEKILVEMHSAQEKLFTTTATWTSLEPEIANLRKQFDDRKTAWKAAIARATANPADPNTGLPVHVEVEAVKPEAGADENPQASQAPAEAAPSAQTPPPGEKKL